MSIVMIISMEIKILGQFLTIFWRIFYDKRLSIMLINLEDTYEQLKHLKLITPLTKRSVLLLFIGVNFHFALHLIRPFDIILNAPKLNVMDRVIKIILIFHNC